MDDRLLLEQIRFVIKNRAWRNGKLIIFIDNSVKNKKLDIGSVDEWIKKKIPHREDPL